MLRKESIPGKSLNLSKDDSLQKQVDACREKYLTPARSYSTDERRYSIAAMSQFPSCVRCLISFILILTLQPRIDFPPAPAVAVKQASMRHEYLEVTTAADIGTEAEYLEELAAYNQQATQHEMQVIQEKLGYNDLWFRIAFFVCSGGMNNFHY